MIDLRPQCKTRIETEGLHQMYMMAIALRQQITLRTKNDKYVGTCKQVEPF